MTTNEKRVRDLFGFSNGRITLPDGWEIDDEQCGGQPNGSNDIEPSDFREWFTAERETHHRRIITLTGPWEKGATEAALIEQRAIQRTWEREIAHHEDQVLKAAQKIIARRAAAALDDDSPI